MSTPLPSSSAAAAATKICFNSLCKDGKSEPPRKKGWRLRSGEHAILCDRCFCSYEQGTFCDNFHADVGGWRNCETCGKRLHCGCIVSAPAFMLLDGGGIECVACARKGLLLAPKQMWSSPLLVPTQPERPKEFPIKGRTQISGQFPGQWRQAANLWNVPSAQSELHQRLAFEFDRPGRSLLSAPEKKIEDLPDRISTSSLNHATRDRYSNGTIALDTVSPFNTYSGEEGRTENGLMVDPRSTNSGIKFEARPGSSVNSLLSSVLKEGAASPHLGLTSFSPRNDPNDPARTPMNQPPRQIAPPSLGQSSPNSQNLVDPSGEPRGHVRNGRPRAGADARARTQLLPRYWPRSTDQELQIGGDPNSQITPLFEKMLSASDAGRIGRLVLPKKCAEAYFPPISQPEGLPLKVQDKTGKEWVFQFRFWPNNNSRMYVLEGVTPCIQAMQLQAGDTVTFSRRNTDGKLVMGFRKASNMSPDQEIQTLKAGNGLEASPEANSKHIPAESVPTLPLRALKGNNDSKNPTSTAEQGTLSKHEKLDFIQKTASAVKSSQAPSKRKGNTLVGSKSKRLRIDHEDSIQLKLTWDAAQDLLRPPPNESPSVVTIEGHEFEEYEEAPVIGMPTFFTTSQDGEKNQWAQCEDCSKWRKLPADALLPSRWTCSNNVWDRERSSCSATQELSMEQLADFLPIKPGTLKRSKVKAETEPSDGLDTLAYLAILDEGEGLPPSSQPTTKHPRHRPGCSCIVCIQPPSGKGPKHKQTCTCNVCLTVKRRFKTLKLRREKRQSEKEEAENTRKNPPHQELDQSTAEILLLTPQRTVANNEEISIPSPLKAQIDLNIQPEREEEPSPIANAGSMARPFSDSAI